MGRTFMPPLREIAARQAKRRGITVDEVLNPGGRPSAILTRRGLGGVSDRKVEPTATPKAEVPDEAILQELTVDQAPSPVTAADRVREDWDHLMTALSAGDIPIITHDPVGLIAFGRAHGIELDAPMVVMRPEDLKDSASAITHGNVALLMEGGVERIDPIEAERIVKLLDGMPHRLPPSDETLTEVRERMVEFKAALDFLSGCADEVPIHPEVAAAYGRIQAGSAAELVLGSEWGARRLICMDELDINMQIRHGDRWTDFRRAMLASNSAASDPEWGSGGSR